MSTIKELAETCGVSEQAIRKWCARNQVAKDVAQRYIIDKTTETAILQHYGKDTRNQVAQPTETSCETSETMKEIIEMLRKELEAKDKRSAAPEHKHNERGAGRKKALSEDQIAEFEKLLQQGAGEKQLRERFGLSRSSYFLYKKRLAEKQ